MAPKFGPILITLNSKFQSLSTFFLSFAFQNFFSQIIQLVELYQPNDSDSR